MSRTALIAGTGALPAALWPHLGPDAVLAEMEGFPAEVPGVDPIRFRLERLVPLIERLEDLGVTRVCFAGAVRRPRLDPEAFDARTAALVPRLIAAMGQGDDGALRAVIGLFEEFGFTVAGLADLAPDLVPGPGVLAGAPTEAARRDIARAAEIVAGLGALDLGQGAVVAAGLCLAVETLPGTDAMLEFVRQTKAMPGGVLYKAPKPAQDRRIDLPAIGPETVARAAAAGLSGIGFEAGGAVLLDRAATLAAADAAGLFLWSRAP